MFILKWIYINLDSAECANFEVANPIKLALTSRETTTMVSVLEVQVKINLPNIMKRNTEKDSQLSINCLKLFNQLKSGWNGPPLFPNNAAQEN